MKMLRYVVVLLALGLLYGPAWADNRALNADTVYYFVDRPAEFPGGENALSRFVARNLHYPEQAREAHLQGRVIVRFVVNVDGSIAEVELLNFKDTALGQEALRIVAAMPKWKAAMHEGKLVRQFVTLPIGFSLD